MHRRLVLSSIILPVALIAALYLALSGRSPGLASAQIVPGAAQESTVHSACTAMAAGAAFTAAIPSDAMTLDPALMTDSRSFLVTAQLYDTLTTYQPGGSVPMPGLADNWIVSPDGKTWTFNLHPGVKFNDGTNLDAAAVAYNFNRWWDPAHPAHNGSFDYFVYLFGGFKGDAGSLIAGVAALNATQFQMTLTTAFSPLPSVLAMPTFAIASPAAIQAGTLMTTPIGSGPFKFVEWAPGNHIRLTAHPDYWLSRPRLDELTFAMIVPGADRLAALQNNAVQSADSFSPSELAAAGSDPNLRVLWRPSTALGYLGINRAHAPLGNPQVRQAIAHAIRQQNLINNFYLPGTEVATQFLPSGIWGRDPGIAGYTYDPALARSLLAQAGFPNGFTTTLATRDVFRQYLPNPVNTAFAIAADLRSVGITVTLVVYESGTFLTKAANGELDLFLLGWGADYLHPDNFFNPILCEGYLAFGPKDDTLCTQVQATLAELNFGNQLAQYQWSSRRVSDTLPLLPLAHSRSAVVVRSNVAGLLPSPISAEAYRGVFFVNVYLPLILK